MKRLLSLMAALAIALGFTATTSAAPAQASCTLTICGNIYHYSPDDGLDPPILIRCVFGDGSTNHNLWEGEYSKKYCRDTDEVYNRDGQEIWCKIFHGGLGGGEYYWDKMFDATGWHKINDIWDDGEGCTVRAD